jgi:sigma-B regulation protein RsbU (phosphoserine phosphatase)
MMHLNEVILRYTVNENFITAFYCIYNKKTGRLNYCGAGHNYPLVLNHQKGTVTELKTKGTILGLFAEIHLEEKEASLQKGDRIIFYTDGLIEIFDESRDMYGEKRLLKFSEENRNLPQKEFSGKLISEITGFSGTDEFKDDVTLLIYDVP